MNRLFDMDNKFFRFMGKLADLCILNILCVVCCIPVITAGASITAMFYVTLKMAKNEESYIVRGFFKSFKENFKQATIINIIMLVIAAVLYADIKIVQGISQPTGKIFYYIFLAFALLYVMVFLYIYPILARFYNTVKRTFLNAVLMSIRHLPYTILMILVSACPVLIFYVQAAQAQSMLLLLFVLVGFALIAYINSFFFVRIFQNYMPPEETEELTAGGAQQ